MRTRRHLLATGGIAALTLRAAPGSAQTAAGEYPDRPVRVIVPFAAGGGNDTLARLYGQRLSELLGQPFIVENRPGAIGLIGATAAIRARPDGLTLVVHPSGPVLAEPGAARPPYDLATDLAPVAALGTFPALIVVAADSPHRSLADVIAWAAAHPDRGSFGTGGIAFRLTLEMLNQRAGTRLDYVAYRSSAEAVNAAAVGEVLLAISDPGPAMPAIEGGRVRVLAVMGPERLAALPQAPVIGDLGYPGLDSLSWIGLFAPAQTPTAIIERLGAAVRRAAAEPALQQRLAALAVTAPSAAAGAEAFRAMVVADAARWQQVAATANISLVR